MERLKEKQIRVFAVNDERDARADERVTTLLEPNSKKLSAIVKVEEWRNQIYSTAPAAAANEAQVAAALESNLETLMHAWPQMSEDDQVNAIITNLSGINFWKKKELRVYGLFGQLLETLKANRRLGSKADILNSIKLRFGIQTTDAYAYLNWGWLTANYPELYKLKTTWEEVRIYASRVKKYLKTDGSRFSFAAVTFFVNTNLVKNALSELENESNNSESEQILSNDNSLENGSNNSDSEQISSNDSGNEEDSD